MCPRGMPNMQNTFYCTSPDARERERARERRDSRFPGRGFLDCCLTKEGAFREGKAAMRGPCHVTTCASSIRPPMSLFCQQGWCLCLAMSLFCRHGWCVCLGASSWCLVARPCTPCQRVCMWLTCVHVLLCACLAPCQRACATL